MLPAEQCVKASESKVPQAKLVFSWQQEVVYGSVFGKGVSAAASGFVMDFSSSRHGT